jgi:succinate dehydrogenase/fumarate reductase cytochrome b subunit
MEQNFDTNEQVVEQTTGQTVEQVDEPRKVVVKPDNNMLMAILTTICCCVPFGIVAIIKASQVNNLFAMKQYEAAQASADEAKKWSYIGIGVGLLIGIVYFIFCFVGIFVKN